MISMAMSTDAQSSSLGTTSSYNVVSMVGGGRWSDKGECQDMAGDAEASKLASD